MGRNSTFELLQELFKEEKKKRRNIKNIDKRANSIAEQGPKKKTIDFILSYAKSIDVVTTKKDNILISLN
jgi:hypothetical protein